MPTATNLAYGVVSHDQTPGGGDGSHMYELVALNQSQPSSSSVRLTATSVDSPSSQQQQGEGLHAVPRNGTEEPTYAVITEK